MYSIQADKTLQQIVKLFYQLGIWQSDEEYNYRKIGKRLFYTFLGGLVPIFYATNAFLCNDRSESIYSAQLSIVMLVLYVKFLNLLYNQKEFLAFLTDPIVVHSIENRDESTETSKKIKKFISFVRPYCFAIFITAVLVIVIKIPIFTAEKSLPMFISFSWNDSEIAYWLAFIFVSLTVQLFCSLNYGTALIWYIMLNFSIEYQLLGNKLKNLGVTTVTTTKIQEKNDKRKKIKQKQLSQKTQKTFDPVPESKKFIEDLIVLVKAHLNVIDTIERFRSCFSTLFLAQITTSGVIICVSVYCLAFVSSQNFIETQMHIIILLYGTFDIFLVMYLANEITLASDQLSYCLYEANWIEQTEACKKYVIIMGEVLKQPQQLVIFVYPMNLETFMRVINGAYSMFNILKSFQ